MRRHWVLPAGALALLVWILLISGLETGSPRIDALTPAASTVSGTLQGVPVAALELRVAEQGLLLVGELPSEAAVNELYAKSQAMYAPLQVQNRLRVRPEAALSTWLGEALAELPLPMPGIDQPEWLLSAEGLRIGGTASDQDARAALHAQLAKRFDGIAVHDALQVASGAVATADLGTPAAPTDSVADAATPPESSPVQSSSGEVSTPVVAGEPHPRQAAVDAMLLAQPVVFASGSTRLEGGTGPDWRALAALLGDTGRVRVRGHTDDRGAASSNRRLSARRAEAVKQALVRAGVAAARIRVEGVGAAEPLVGNDTAAGRQRNRRIEIRLEGGA